MYDDYDCTVELLCDNELMKTIVDRFGEEVQTRRADAERFIATVDVSVSSTFYSWVFTYVGKIKISELHSRVKRSLPLNSDALTTRLREPLKDMTSTRTLFERNCISGLPLATCRLAMRHTSSTS